MARQDLVSPGVGVETQFSGPTNERMNEQHNTDVFLELPDCNEVLAVW